MDAGNLPGIRVECQSALDSRHKRATNFHRKEVNLHCARVDMRKATLARVASSNLAEQEIFTTEGIEFTEKILGREGHGGHPTSRGSRSTTIGCCFIGVSGGDLLVPAARRG